MRQPTSAAITRRHFLTGAAAAAVLTPSFIPRRAFGANERITTGHVGVGGQGMSNLKRLIEHAVAVCDVDKKRAAAAQKPVADKTGKCDVYGDYRQLLDRKDIDAVVVSTPDHWHALPTVQACEAGKHVYCEKPLTLTIYEGRAMVNAARRNKCVVQTGSQQRSAGNFRTACELVRSGRIGKITSVEVGIPGCNHPGALGPDSGVQVHIGQKYKGGTTFIGDKGTIYVNRGKLSSTPEEIIKEPLRDGDVHLVQSADHHRNWLECIQTGALPICDVEIGHRTATACHLANLCVLVGRKIRWDPVQEKILDDDEKVAAMVHRPYRAPWKL
jgi:predicted dehydrogenase